ncbi:MAG: hypothetical protein MZV70_59670 [Desulfobacterales bacterium]|nr:hypothetical protein [Desulfobacterales bacterium]
MSNSVLFVVKGKSFDVTILSPVADQTVSQGRTIVQGGPSIPASGDIGIQANGMAADIKGNTWVVGDVPLVPGENTHHRHGVGFPVEIRKRRQSLFCRRIRRGTSLCLTCEHPERRCSTDNVI